MGYCFCSKKITTFAESLGFDDLDKTKIEIVTSELVRNIVKYARNGIIVYQEVSQADKRGLHISAIDKGNGIIDLEKALENGYTTSGGLGLGLPSVMRLMDEFEIVSEVGGGTKVVVSK